MKREIFSTLILFLATQIMAETILQDEITAKSFSPSGNPYIVKKDIIIPVDQEVLIKAGCVFLFDAFTGIHCNGKLVVEGTLNEPVIFTSINDQDYNPNSQQLANPFDWNGILVGRESSGAFMKNFHLRYSVYGIKGQTPSIMIQNGKLRQNGQFHFTINDKIQNVHDGIPFSYGISKDSDESEDDSSGKKDKKKKDRSRGSRGEEPKQKKIFRYTCLGVGVAGLVTGAIFSGIAIKDRKDWIDIADKGQLPTESFPQYLDRYEAAESKYRSRIAPLIITSGIGALGITGFFLTFAF